MWIGVFKCNDDGAECEFNSHVFVLTISRFMLPRAAKALLMFGLSYLLVLYDGGSLVDCCHMMYSYIVCCMSESMFSAYTKKKNYFPLHSFIISISCKPPNL